MEICHEDFENLEAPILAVYTCKADEQTSRVNPRLVASIELGLNEAPRCI